MIIATIVAFRRRTIALKLSWPQEPKLIASHRLNGDGYKIELSRTEIAMSEKS